MLFDLYRAIIKNAYNIANDGATGITLFDMSGSNNGSDDVDVTIIGSIYIPDNWVCYMNKLGEPCFESPEKVVFLPSYFYVTKLPNGIKRLAVDGSAIDLLTWFNETVLPQYDLNTCFD